MPNEVRVKKVNLYPISANLQLRNGTVIPTQILKLTLVGVMADVSASQIKAGDQLQLTFSLPGIQRQLQENVVVVKFYNKFAEPGSQKKTSSDGATSMARSSSDSGGGGDHGSGAGGSSGGSKLDTPYGNVQHITELHFKPLTSNTASAIRAVFSSMGKTV